MLSRKKSCEFSNINFCEEDNIADWFINEIDKEIDYPKIIVDRSRINEVWHSVVDDDDEK